MKNWLQTCWGQWEFGYRTWREAQRGLGAKTLRRARLRLCFIGLGCLSALVFLGLGVAWLLRPAPLPDVTLPPVQNAPEGPPSASPVGTPAGPAPSPSPEATPTPTSAPTSAPTPTPKTPRRPTPSPEASPHPTSAPTPTFTGGVGVAAPPPAPTSEAQQEGTP